MTNLKHLLLAAAALLASASMQAAGTRLAYNARHQFKIAQFTDIHWDEKSTDKCTRTLHDMQAVIDAEHPDFIVVSGDVVTSQPARKGWESIISFFHRQGIPFAVEMGNHDHQQISVDSIYAMLTQCPTYAGAMGNHVTGFGNVSLPIYASDGSAKVSSVIYLLDSGADASDPLYGDYDWIHFDQIAWYRSESKRFTAGNGGKPLPSLAYFHIPLPEYRDVLGKPETFGRMNEGEICAGGINSGMLASIVEMGDVMATFCGHDHENDFIGMHCGVALAYGRVSGWSAYGSFVRGARIVLLNENSRFFDTWISTPQGKETVYHYPSGINSMEENSDCLKAVKASPKKHGVAYTYYEGNILSCSQIDSLKPVKTGVLSNFDITKAPADDHFAYVFKALFKATKKTVYKFRMRSDDGAQLYIDDKLVINNDGSHSASFVVGKVALDEGFHRITVRYFEDYSGQVLELNYLTPDISEQPIPNDLLYVPTDK